MGLKILCSDKCLCDMFESKIIQCEYIASCLNFCIVQVFKIACFHSGRKSKASLFIYSTFCSQWLFMLTR